MSKTVISASSLSAVRPADAGQRRHVHSFTPVFDISGREIIPRQLATAVGELATRQVCQIGGAHKAKGDSGSGRVVIVSSKGLVQLYRKNPDGTIGQLIVEAAAYPESGDK